MIDIYDDLDGELSASEVIASLQKHNEELEALISQGFQDLKGRDVADALIDNANLSDRIEKLEAEVTSLQLMKKHLRQYCKNHKSHIKKLEARIDKALKHLPERPGMAMGFLLEKDGEE
jgi:predicted RNase H-like nuclease (RuvC/YqgF family)